MSILFFDGFDFYNSIGPGGRKWDQGSSVNGFAGGRWGGQCVKGGTGAIVGQTFSGTHKTFATDHHEVIIGTAVRVNSLYGTIGISTVYDGLHPLIMFRDHGTVQCSVRIDPVSGTLCVYADRGMITGNAKLCDTGYVPPVTLWFYLEVKLTVGSPGAIEVRVNGETVANVTGIQTQQTGNNTINEICLCATGQYNSSIYFDDVYVLDTQDATGSVDFLGEVRVQTKYVDATGYQNDFFQSITSSENSFSHVITNYTRIQMVNDTVTDYTENGFYIASGTVGAKELYSVQNFTVTGTIFAVQENLSFRKDDVGNRSIVPLMRTASQEYEGEPWACYSDYTYAGKVWEANPATGNPWSLTDLNQAEFGVKVAS